MMKIKYKTIDVCGHAVYHPGHIRVVDDKTGVELVVAGAAVKIADIADNKKAPVADNKAVPAADNKAEPAPEPESNEKGDKKAGKKKFAKG